VAPAAACIGPCTVAPPVSPGQRRSVEPGRRPASPGSHAASPPPRTDQWSSGRSQTTQHPHIWSLILKLIS